MRTGGSFPRILLPQNFQWDERTHHKLLHNSRYVDNRVLLHFPGWREHYPWSLFTKLDFYEAPILVEEVDDTEILGCIISTAQRTITVRQPKDLVSDQTGFWDAWSAPTLPVTQQNGCQGPYILPCTTGPGNLICRGPRAGPRAWPLA